MNIYFNFILKSFLLNIMNLSVSGKKNETDIKMVSFNSVAY